MGDGFAFLDIIIFAMLAGYLVFQLRRVLGRRSGNQERRPTNSFKRQSDDVAKRQSDDVAEHDNVVTLGSHTANDSLVDEPPNLDPEINGLTQLKIADPEFDDREFLRGAKGAFEWIVAAFSSGDRKELRNLLSPPLLESFEAAIDEREKASETLETTISSIKSVTIDDVTLEGSVVAITVEFITDQVKTTRDAQGNVVEGDPSRIDTLTDIWIFSRDTRSKDPNWQLVGTRESKKTI